MFGFLNYLPFIGRRREEEATAIPDIARVVPEWAASRSDEPECGEADAGAATQAGPFNETEDLATPPLPDTEADARSPGPASHARPGAWLEPAPLSTAEQGSATLLDEDIDMLLEAFEVFADTEGMPDARNGLELAAETLRATAARADHPSLSRVCRSLCRLLDASDDTALVNLHVQAIRAIRAAQPSSASDDLAGAVCIALETRVDAAISN